MHRASSSFGLGVSAAAASLNALPPLQWTLHVRISQRIIQKLADILTDMKQYFRVRGYGTWVSPEKSSY